LRNAGSKTELNGQYILKGLQKIGYHAINIGENDIRIGYQTLLTWERTFDIPFISANIYRKEDNSPLFNPYVIVNCSGLKIAIFGILSNNPSILNGGNNARDLYIKDPVSIAQDIVEEVSTKSDVIIAAANIGYEKSKELIQHVKGIDIVLSSHNAFNPMKAISIDNTVIAQSKYQGRYVGDIIFKINNRKKIDGFEDYSRPLNQSIGEDPDFDNLIKEYRYKIAQINKKSFKTSRSKSSQAPMTRKTGYYVGSNVCRDCHLKQFNQWKNTKHATAFVSITKEEKTNIQQCYPCHTTGYLTSNGFRNQQTTPELINVQCEECHGTRFTHVRVQTFSSQQPNSAASTLYKLDENKSAINSSTCTKCHTEERDHNFDYQHSIHLVAH